MDLHVTLHGQRHSLELKNPVLTASGTFGYGAEFSAYGNLSSLGGFIVKGLSLEPRQGNRTPRIVETTAGMLNAVGLQNDGAEYFLSKTLPRLPWQHTAVIANIYAASVEEFASLAARLDTDVRISALEVNISCPNVKCGGVLFGQDPDLAAEVTRAVCEHAPHKHVMVKLSPNVTDIKAIARAVEAAGADSISCINTLQGMSIDYRTRRPRLANIIGGLSGPAIKPVALRCVWQVASSVKIPVIGVGGICCCEDILEFIIAGASAVEIGTANFMDPRASFSMVQDLPRLCEECGITSLQELRGSLKLDEV
ncbi:MAG: dihydroorotate dehydrogenase [Desulfovibrio sp.]|nr:dihydroorotate dehydrogenase [Desulfovibrio sp.]